MTERRFYVPPEDLDEIIRLGKEESRHLARVLRLSPGDEVRVFDGRGRECVYRVEKINKDDVRLAFVAETEPTAPESNIKVELAVPLLKKSNTDLVLQKMVELGVTRFIPLISKRSEVAPARWKHERAVRIVLEAAKQCGRASAPSVSEPIEFERFVANHNGTGFFFYERGGGKLPNSIETDRVVAITGPEGGWEQSEVELAGQSGFELIHLGGRILRAETAPIVAATLLQHRFGDLG